MTAAYIVFCPVCDVSSLVNLDSKLSLTKFLMDPWSHGVHGPYRPFDIVSDIQADFPKAVIQLHSFDNGNFAGKPTTIGFANRPTYNKDCTIKECQERTFEEYYHNALPFQYKCECYNNEWTFNCHMRNHLKG